MTMGGYPYYIGVFGGFEAVLVWKLDGLVNLIYSLDLDNIKMHLFEGCGINPL